MTIFQGTQPSSSEEDCSDEPGNSKQLLLIRGFSFLFMGMLLYLVSRNNYLLFHSIAEIFSIAVAFAVFMLVWNSRKFIQNDALVFLGIAYLFVGSIDLLHTLAYKGMNVFPTHLESNLATQLWIGGRYLESVSLLVFATVLGRSVDHVKVLLVYLAVLVVLLATIFIWPIFPTCFNEQTGLTFFKKASEYFICIVLLSAAISIWHQRHRFSPSVLKLIVSAIVLTILGELAFTFYISVYGFSNLVGHYLKIASYLLIYIALIQSGLTRPYAELFRELNQKKEELDRTNQRWLAFSNFFPYPLSMIDGDGQYLVVNQAVADLLDKERTEIEGKSFAELFPPETAKNFYRRVEKVKKDGISEEVEDSIVDSTGRTRLFRTILFPLDAEVGEQPIYGSLAFDITEQHAAEDALRKERALLEARVRISEASPHLDMQQLLQLVLDETEHLVKSSISFFHFLTNGEKDVVLQAWSTGTHSHHCQVENTTRHYPVDKAGVWTDCIRQRKPVVHNDYQALSHRKGLPEGHAPVIRQLVVPIIRGEEIVAILGVGNKTEDYTREDVATATQLADLAWDIVSSRRSEVQLNESQRTLQTLVGNLPGIAFRCRNDTDYTMEYMSEGTMAITGYAPEELIGNRESSFGNLIVPEDREKVWRVVQDGLEEQKPYEVEYRIIKKDKTTCWIWERGVGIRSQGGDLVAIEGFIADISERRNWEMELQRLASAVEQAAEVILITDTQGVIQYVNPAFTRVTGYTPEEVLGKKPDLLSSGKQDQFFYRNLWDTIQSGRVWSGRFINRKKDGAFFTEEGTIAPVTSSDGSITNYVAVKRDITESLEHEQRLSQAQKMEAIGVLAGGIAHDFNNILAPILGYTELLQEDLEGDSQAQSGLEKIMEAAYRAKELVHQILAFSRQHDQHLVSVNIQSIVKESLKLIRATLPTTIRIDQDIDEKCSPVWADPTQVHQVVMNLITNAYHAMEGSGGTLSVNVHSMQVDSLKASALDLLPGPYACIEVADTGKGITPEVLSQIFNPYFTTKPEGKGTGLGLSVVHGIVQSYKGAIDVSSVPGKGTVFTVYIPNDASRAINKAEAVRDFSDYQGNGEHILVVDDESAVVQIVSAILRQLNYTVTGHSDSTAALGLFSHDPTAFDLVVTDMTMPNLTGLELGLKIKKISPHTPVILCTGYSAQVDADIVEEAGMEGLLYKPIAKNELAGFVHHVLSRKS